MRVPAGELSEQGQAGERDVDGSFDRWPGLLDEELLDLVVADGK